MVVDAEKHRGSFRVRVFFYCNVKCTDLQFKTKRQRWGEICATYRDPARKAASSRRRSSGSPAAQVHVRPFCSGCSRVRELECNACLGNATSMSPDRLS